MKKIYLLTLFFFLINTSSCKKDNFIIIEGIESLSFQCLEQIPEHQVINSADEYSALLDEYRDYTQSCLTYFSPQIDFTEKTLLGQRILVTACNVSSVSEVFADPDQKRYIYQLRVNMEGDCEMIFERVVWIVVPKLPDNYIVTFKANYERI